MGEILKGPWKGAPEQLELSFELRASAFEKALMRTLDSIGSGTPESKRAWAEAIAEQQAEELANQLPVMTVFPAYD